MATHVTLTPSQRQALERKHERTAARELRTAKPCSYCGRRARTGTYPPTCAYCSDLPGCEEL